MRECVTIVDDVDDSNGIVDDCGVFEIEPLQQDPSFSTKVREPDESALRSFIRRGSWFMLLFATVTVLSEEIYLFISALWPRWRIILEEEGSTQL